MNAPQKIRFVFSCLFTVFIMYDGMYAQNTNEALDTLYDPALYDPEIISPSYPDNTGPSVFLDEGHNNRHLFGGLGSFTAFRKVLIKDGYQVIPFTGPFTAASLQDKNILVVSCAQNEKNLWPEWYNPTYSAFDRSEQVAIQDWVDHGGSLFLIIDHHPFPGAAIDLAKEFGFELYNGHADDTIRYPSYFHRANGTLHSNVITNGRDSDEQIDSILSFSGSAMRIPDDASPILTFNEGWIQWLPDTTWKIDDIEPTSISGLAQGAFKRYGNGKIVIFTDANMFSAQDTEWGGRMGFINPNAKCNYRLLVNIIRYLDGLIDDSQ